MSSYSTSESDEYVQPYFSLHSEGIVEWVGTFSPSQERLVTLVNNYRNEIKSLTITTPWFGNLCNSLNFGRIGILPNLEKLYLEGIKMPTINFNTSNTPALRSLELISIRYMDNRNEDGCLDFDLDLPQLRRLVVNDTTIDGICNFTMSILRSPFLEHFSSDNFDISTFNNYLLLPSCTYFAMDRMHFLQSLEILKAPKLVYLSITGSNIQHFRFWDFQCQITIDDVIYLTEKLRLAIPHVRLFSRMWQEEWKYVNITAQDLYEQDIIQDNEIEGCTELLETKSRRFVMKILQDYVERRSRNIVRTEVMNEFIQRISSRLPIHDPSSLPLCSTNLSFGEQFSRDSRKQIREISRLQINSTN